MGWFDFVVIRVLGVVSGVLAAYKLLFTNFAALDVLLITAVAMFLFLWENPGKQEAVKYRLPEREIRVVIG